jgi:hypothetical protein
MCPELCGSRCRTPRPSRASALPDGLEGGLYLADVATTDVRSLRELLGEIAAELLT